jgi:hypothetical protein
VNQHTNTTEFHGNSSSLAFLHQLQKKYGESQITEIQHSAPRDSSYSLVSSIYDPALTPSISSTIDLGPSREDRFYFHHAHKFQEGYFDNIHYVHPFIDKTRFISRAEDLWFGRPDQQKLSFKALYFSVLSLGALVRAWDEATLDGMNRFQWSWKLFLEAEICLRDLHFSNDLDVVQCLYFMVNLADNKQLMLFHSYLRGYYCRPKSARMSSIHTVSVFVLPWRKKGWR